MKLYLAYKKQSKQMGARKPRAKGSPAAFSGFLLVIFIILPILAYGETAEGLRKKIDQKDSDIAQLELEIKTYQTELDNLEKQKSSLSTSIKQLDLTRKKLITDIAVTQKKISKTNLKIQGLNSDISGKENSISNNKDSIALGLRHISEFEQNNILETMLSENDFTAVWNDLDNVTTVQDKIREKVLELKQIKSELEDTRGEAIDAKNELTALKLKLSDQQKIVVQNTNEKNKLLKQTKNNEANYQKLLKDRIAQRDAFEKELRDYEAELQFILDPSKLPPGGVLSWPLEKIFVTQLFGKTANSGRLYASGTHNGVDFRAYLGTPVMTMSDGVVLGIGDTDLTCSGASFGKFVFIKYNNGLSSTFGHLSLIKVREGDQVKRGEIVGYSGNTGHTTGPHLHVSLYVSEAVKMESRPSRACDGRIYRLPVAPVNAYLDAMYYLPPYEKRGITLNLP